MRDIFKGNQRPLPLNTPEDFCAVSSLPASILAMRRNESPLADLLDEINAAEAMENIVTLIDEFPTTVTSNEKNA
jgi:hypothetical protein